MASIGPCCLTEMCAWRRHHEVGRYRLKKAKIQTERVVYGTQLQNSGDGTYQLPERVRNKDCYRSENCDEYAMAI